MSKHKKARQRKGAPQIASDRHSGNPYPLSLGEGRGEAKSNDGPALQNLSTPYSYYIDSTSGDITNTQYSQRPITAGDKKTLVLNDIRIFAPNVTPLGIKDLMVAYENAINRYYPLRRALYDIYEVITVTEGHLVGIIGKRFDKILNKPLYFKKDGKIDVETSKLINTTKFRNMCREILKAQLWGVTGFEFVPGKLFDPRMIPRKNIKTKWQIISFEETGTEGIDYTDLANIYVIGEPEDLGSLLACCIYAIFKRNAVADWAQYLQIFGQPFRIMKYDVTDIQGKQDLAKTLKESGGALELMIPNTIDFDIKDGKQSNADGSLQQKFTETMDKSMSVIILGNVESTTSSAVGSHAKAKVQKDEQDDITKNDLFYLTAALNDPHFLNILSDYGYNVEGGAFEHSQEISIAYLSERIKIDIEMPEALPIDDDYWYNTYGIEKPANYAALKAELLEKQKQIQQAGTIEADPKNTPPKKKTPNQKYKNVPLVTLRDEAPISIKALFKAFLSFFAHART